MKWSMGHEGQDMVRLKLSGELTLGFATELKEALTQALNAAPEIVIELENDAEVDLSCLQLFCAAHQTAMSLGLKMSLAMKHNKQFQDVTCLAGLCREKKCAIHPEMGCLLAGGYL
ncbi:MAG: STAS domain-containing protein [Proteobacteria bacterium]|nr:STAS domain-containing protein [Desulfobulbaceae bacterium]MBU4151761.1 STAS domain-containing protein [Pseudomonadota bacterium]